MSGVVLDMLTREVHGSRHVGIRHEGGSTTASLQDRGARLASLRRDCAEHQRKDGNDGARCTKKERNNGKMFVQVPIGQRIRLDGADVLKFTVISFTLPDLLDKNFEIVNAIKGSSDVLGGIAGNAVSFTRDASLIGCFGTSESHIAGRELHEIIFAVYDAIEQIVIRNKSSVPEQDFEDFISKNKERKDKISAVVSDALTIFSTPGHTGAIAYRNGEKFGKSFFRMEWLYKDFSMITMGPPTTGYKLGVFDESIASDEGDKEFIRALMRFIEAAYKSGASTVVGLQVNNTATVARCGALDTEDKAMQEARRMELRDMENNRDLHYATFVHDGAISSGTGNGRRGDAANKEEVQDSDESGGGTKEVRKCQGCGNVIARGSARCSCGNQSHHQRL